MKVFFSMSFRGDTRVGKHIYEILVSLRCAHTSLVFKNPPELSEFRQWPEIKRTEQLKKLYEDLLKADIMITELTIHSSISGMLIQKAITHNIPVLVLYQEKSSGRVYHDMEKFEDKLLALQYSSKNLLSMLKEGMDYLLSKSDKRFTIILPPRIVQYLNEKANKGVTRSDYIRTLITKDMTKK